MLGLLAGQALLQELLDIPLKSAPIEVLAHSLVGRRGARMPAHHAVVHRGNELGV